MLRPADRTGHCPSAPPRPPPPPTGCGPPKVKPLVPTQRPPSRPVCVEYQLPESIFSLQIKKKQKNTDPLSCPKVLSYVYTECLCCRLMEGKTEERRGEFPTENRLTLTFTVFPNSSLSFVGLSAPFAFSGGIMLLNE